jgi:hypothetical protein
LLSLLRKVIGLPQHFVVETLFNINANNFGIVQDMTNDLYIITIDTVSKVIKNPFEVLHRPLHIMMIQDVVYYTTLGDNEGLFGNKVCSLCLSSY